MTVYAVSDLCRGHGTRPVPYWRTLGVFSGPDALRYARKWASPHSLITAHDDEAEAYAAAKAKHLDTTTMKGRVVP